MSTALLLQLVSSAGLLSGVAALLSYVNARKGYRAKVTAEARHVYERMRMDLGPMLANVDQLAHEVMVERLRSDQPGTSMRPAPDRSWAKLSGDARDAAGEVYHWCQGCDQTPNARLMAWTEGGLYRCRSCRAPSTGRMSG